MFSRILWGITLGSLIALVWVGYRRGKFDSAGRQMRYGMDRVKEGLQVAANRVREGLHMVGHRTEEGAEILGDTVGEKAMQGRNRIEEAAGF